MLAFSTPSPKTVILGSVHALPANAAPFTEAVRNLVEASQRVVFEADTSAVDPEIFYYGGEGDLRELVKPALYRRILETAAQLGLDAEDLTRRPPWSAAMCLFQARIAGSGVLFEHGVDYRARDAAVAFGKEILFWEEPAAGFLCFREAPLEEQVRGLERLIEEPERAEQDLLAILRGWVRRRQSARVDSG